VASFAAQLHPLSLTRLPHPSSIARSARARSDPSRCANRRSNSAMDIHTFNTTLIARMIEALSSIKEGDRFILDSSFILYTSENGEQHHSAKTRWPLVLIGDAGGKLRTGGRFLRYPMGSKSSRSLADFFCSLSTASGSPTDDSGKGGNEPVLGPLPELMS